MKTILFSIPILILIGFSFFTPSKQNHQPKSLTDSCRIQVTVKNSGTPIISVSATDGVVNYGPTSLVTNATASWWFYRDPFGGTTNKITFCLKVLTTPHRAGRFKLTGSTPSNVIFCNNVPANDTTKTCTKVILYCDSSYFLEYKDTTCPN